MLDQRDIQRERLFYIDFLTFFTGRVSRKDIVTRFGISDPAATKDLSLYAELAPGRLAYDLRQKCYVFGMGEPCFTHDIEQTLYALAGERALAINPQHAKRLPSWVHCDIRPAMSLSIVAAITRSIYQGLTVSAEYTSLSSGSKKRTLSPKALVNDGLRWHVRCFDHDSEHEDFRDYNITRFTAVAEGGPSNILLEDDPDWNTEVQLKLVPHPNAEHAETIKMDYGIDDAKFISLKPCIVGYFLRHWHIDYSDDASGNPRAQQLFLANKKELLECGLSKWIFDM
jgi:hypothetical protein